MSALPECVELDRTPVTVMLTQEQAVRLEVWLAGQRDTAPAMDDNARVDLVFEMGLAMIEHLRTAPADNPGLIAIQRELAYSAARSDIECLCIGLGDGWYQAGIGTAAEDAAIVNFATRYLSGIGMLESSPTHPGVVRVRELDAGATA